MDLFDFDGSPFDAFPSAIVHGPTPDISGSVVLHDQDDLSGSVVMPSNNLGGSVVLPSVIDLSCSVIMGVN